MEFRIKTSRKSTEKILVQTTIRFKFLIMLTYQQTANHRRKKLKHEYFYKKKEVKEGQLTAH